MPSQPMCSESQCAGSGNWLGDVHAFIHEKVSARELTHP
ncbi:hypothetical protein M2321_004131 [Rhodoblastus acidophilus]|nr:hypothetical protein [Rhodoblastus acidophilus]